MELDTFGSSSTTRRRHANERRQRDTIPAEHSAAEAAEAQATADRAELTEGDADGPVTLYVYQGLRGVCNALDPIAERRDIDLYADLSAAAAVLIGMLEERRHSG